MDFGGLKLFKEWADYMFDHTLIVAYDDPHLDRFKALAKIGNLGQPEYTALVDLRIADGVGCEMFAKMCYDKMAELLEEMKQNKHSRYPVEGSVRLVSAEVFEHDANSAIYEG